MVECQVKKLGWQKCKPTGKLGRPQFFGGHLSVVDQVQVSNHLDQFLQLGHHPHHLIIK